MVEHVSKCAPKQRDPLSLDQLGEILKTLHSIKGMSDYKSFAVKPVSEATSPMRRLAVDIHSIFRRETTELNQWFMRKDGAFDRQLQAVAFDYPEFEAFKSEAIAGLEQVKKESELGISQLIETVKQLPEQPSLSDIWTFLDRYRTVYSAIEKHSNSRTAKETIALFDSGLMKDLCAKFKEQLCDLEDVRLDLAAPDDSQPPITLTVPNYSDDYSVAMAIMALSAGRGLQRENVPASIRDNITEYNRTTTSIIDRWSSLGDTLLHCMQEQHGDMDIDKTALMQRNHFALGKNRNAALIGKMREALPEIIARIDDARCYTNPTEIQARSQFVDWMADYLGESVKTMREQNNGVAIKS